MTEKTYNIRQIPFGTQIESATHAAFVCLYARHCKPYDVPNPEIPDAIRHLITPRILLYGRHDDTTGWPGGSCEEKDFQDAHNFIDGLKVAAAREANQEIGCDLQLDKLEPICSHFYAAGKVTHLFGYETDYETLIQIYGHFTSMKKHFAESTGLNLSTVLAWKKPGIGEFDLQKGIFARFQQLSPPAFREELYQALFQLRLVDIDVLREIERHFMSPAYFQNQSPRFIATGLKSGD